MSRTVLIRADGTKSIGMGHINRCSLVAKMLETRFGLKAKLLIKKDAAGEAFAAARGLEVVAFDAPGLKEEIEFLQVYAFEQDAPVLFILDVLKNDTDAFYIDCIHKFMCPVLAITDDTFERVIDADVIVNGNPSQAGRDYSAEQGRGKYLLGPRHFLLDPAYAKAHDRRPDGKIKNVLVTMGGTDHNDILFKLLSAFKTVPGDFELAIVASGACGYIDRLKTCLANYPKPWRLHMDVPTLIPLWQAADAAVTAGGNTLFERIAACVPGATLCQLTQQMEVADGFAKLGVNVNLGFGPDIYEQDLRTRLAAFLQDTEEHRRHYELAPRVVDGGGLERLGDALEPFVKEIECSDGRKG
jgi:spore coat polysaccharide biosynthesis predicted glycosyltransferase SpsG